MAPFEEPVTCAEISRLTGGSVSAETVRAACHRGKDYHPLPHVRCGSKRPVLRIRWSTFCKWYEEEEQMQVRG